MQQYLESTYFLDYDHPKIRSYISRYVDEHMSASEKAVSLYHAVRDDWRYMAHTIHFNKEEWKASNIMDREEGHCLDKAIILTACLRAAGVPARLHLAKVKNHIAAEHMIEKFGTDELTPHGMLDVLIDGHWIKISPSFNKELCDLLNVDSLDFDGKNDCIFQQFDKEGGLFMEYLEDYGHFEDVPLDFIYIKFSEHYEGLKNLISDHGVLTI